MNISIIVSILFSLCCTVPWISCYMSNIHSKHSDIRTQKTELGVDIFGLGPTELIVSLGVAGLLFGYSAKI